jgi:hypothetical protein
MKNNRRGMMANFNKIGSLTVTFVKILEMELWYI